VTLRLRNTVSPKPSLARMSRWRILKIDGASQISCRRLLLSFLFLLNSYKRPEDGSARGSIFFTSHCSGVVMAAGILTSLHAAWRANGLL
jgi:hypothetical protein